MRKGFVIVIFSFVVSANVSAAPVCKGLLEATCHESDQCRWVAPYTRKDKRQVAGYCRAKSSKSKSTDTLGKGGVE